MKRLGKVLLLAFALRAQTPTAEEMLAKARKATGAGAIKSLTISGVRRLSVNVGGISRMVSREVRMDFLLPDKFLRAERIDLPGGIEGPTVIDALDGAVSWRDVRGAQITAMPGTQGVADARVMRAVFLRYVLLFTLGAPGIRFEAAGEGIMDAKGPEQFTLRMFFDQKAGLLSRVEWDDHALRLDDYARFSGVLLPRALTLTVKGTLVEEFEIKSATINPELKPEQFRK